MEKAEGLAGEESFLAGDGLPAALAIDIDVSYAILAIEGAAVLAISSEAR